MKIIECKRVDLWDGGDRHHFGFYIDEEVPDTAIKTAYPHCTVRNERLAVFDTLDEVKENDVKKLRESALAKLTPLERKALGF